MGKVYIKLVLLYTLLILCIITDIKVYKIKNGIVVPFIIIGLLFNILLNEEFISSILGTFLPFFSLFILYRLHMIGAGDIKLFCAIGAIMGIEFLIPTFFNTFIACGVFSLIIIMKNNNLTKSYKKIKNYFHYCILNGRLLEYNKNDGIKISLSLWITIGVTLSIFINNKLR